jgi:allantoinase
MTFDLAIEEGTVVTPEGRRRTSVYVRDGRIARVAAAGEPAQERFDASGLLVMPGMVDTHVHLMDPGDPQREDFPTGTAAAARAGVTTVIEHTHSSPVRTAADLRDKAAYLASRSVVDFGLAAHAWPDHLDHVGGLWRAGAAYLKVFTCTTHGVPGFDAAHLLELMRRVAAHGAVCLVHCEDESITAFAEEGLRRTGRQDGAVVCEWRNRDAEAVAMAMTALLARRTGARTVIAHVSHPEALQLATRERERGAQLMIESCPQYLTLLEEEVLEFGALRKFTPPARARSARDLDAMWAALADRRIHHLSTDHAPSTKEHKTQGSIWDVHFGLPGIDTTLPVLLSAAAERRISYEDVSRAYSEAPARTYGLWPRKGSLFPGADADFVLIDPRERWPVSDADIVSKAGWSPYSGRTLTGRAVATFLRGRIVASNGTVVGEPGGGRFLPGAGAVPSEGATR